MPEISVIIPVYNRPQLLVESAESVFAQSFDDWELLIIDDGSTDNTSEVAAGLAKSKAAGGRCRHIVIPRSGYPGAARNRGVETASGRYVAFLDSDDRWLPDKLALQYKRMRDTGSRIAHTREIWQRGERIVSQKGQKHKRSGDIFADALKKCIIGPSTVMMERSLYVETGGFHESIEIAEDYEYWLRITCEYPVDYLGEALTVKRAGDWPQLSEKYGMIERFRLEALAGLLGVEIPGETVREQKYLAGYRWAGFSPERRADAIEELIFKCGVWAAGCRKRGRISQAGQFDAIIRNAE
ncbi:MAG: glycosyltransferase family A protein [Spirochaetales bacterium]|uniref:Glycosyltransferase family A protein n=1 Tax=Candidatus Thalassospirochaeta sargassi TaxID=3119039 RepID=A0AAJ1MNL4_9SPIO|nr:glycosyltransferase family A protein [Spirochaetales bacterium]